MGTGILRAYINISICLSYMFAAKPKELIYNKPKTNSEILLNFSYFNLQVVLF